ncbi:MAG: NrsF family protein [Bdellovibrionota bacterium]
MDILILGIPSALLLFFMLSKSANTFPKWSGYLACIASFSLAAMGSRYTCMDISSIHFLVWHFFPVVILGWIGFGLGQKVLKF